MKIQIFYSWQDTTDRKYNRYFILNCINKAVKDISKKPEFKGIKISVLEGVKGEPGSVPVASTILENRIPNSDIFIADLSVVNQVPSIIKFLQNLTSKKFKPFQNNNVINEFGVATNAIGYNGIIGILNSNFGSPNENPSNIHFDIKHLRFPIQYNYSKNTKNKADIEKTLVNSLIDALKPTIVFALQNQKNKYAPLAIWNQWQNSMLIEQDFIGNDKTDEINKAILQGIENNNGSIRILGLSGLGKTRILFEIFRPKENEEKSVILSSRVLYINCHLYPDENFQAILNKMILEQEDRIVILDNCSISLHRKVMHFTNRNDSRIAIITLDSNPEEIERDKINGVNYLVLKKEDLNNVVDEILKRDFNTLSEQALTRIKEFAQGIPLMAVLLAESVKRGEKFIGKLEDKDLLDKLLGSKGQEPKNRTILMSCSIFNYFGFYDELISQVEFISINKNITSLNGDELVLKNDFTEICNYYLKREIFEKKGRFLSMRPFPLAISLAQEWLETLSPKRIISVIADIANLSEPDRGQLSEAFAEQMKFLGYNKKAVEIVDAIIGPDSPFDNAEVLNTELGSRFFRSFVEVNPIAVSKNFTRQFKTKSTEELLEIKTGRRNLVWVLEKLCFDERTFDESIKILFSFAVAENESWSNNATGQFLQLFNLFLSGTEANLEKRWEIIKWGLTKDDQNYKELAIRAMSAGLKYHHFTRTGGAEKQGIKTLKDNIPLWPEIVQYWENIIINLHSIIISSSQFSNLASSIISNNIRSLLEVGLGKFTLDHLNEIAKFKQYDWDEIINALKLSKKHEGINMSEEILEDINELIKLLTKNDFLTKYRSISTEHYFEIDGKWSDEKIIMSVEKLATEFISSESDWDEALQFFYSGQQSYAYYFGKKISELLNGNELELKKFIEESIKKILSINIENPSLTLLGGFVSGISTKLKEDFFSILHDNKKLNHFLFYFVSIDSDPKEYFDLLFSLVDARQCDISSFYAFNYTPALLNLSVIEIENFSERMFSYGDEGFLITFHLLYDIGYKKEELKQTLLPIFKKCIYKLGFKKKPMHHLENFKWCQAICEIISNSLETDFASFINISVIESITWENSYHLDNQMQRIYEILMTSHFETIWPKLSEALLAKEEHYEIFLGMKNILGSHIGGVSRLIGIIVLGNIEKIFKWCSLNSPNAPYRLAELSPIFEINNMPGSDWHPMAFRIINEFGDSIKVLSGLATNMGNYSWSGSLMPLLEGKKKIFENVINHEKETVRIWANENIIYLDRKIADQQNSDEEWEMN